MKKIYTRAVSLLTLLVAVLATSCTNEIEAPQDITSGRTLILSAEMPDEAGLRVGVEEDNDAKTLRASWKVGDKVTFVFRQGEEVTVPMEVTIGKVDAAGKGASMSIEVPDNINLDAAYTIHAFSGIPGTGVSVSGGDILVDILPIRADRLQDLVVPVIAEQRVNGKSQSREVRLTFSYLGSIEYINLKNASDESLTVFNCHLQTANKGASEWRYVPGKAKHYSYNVRGERVVEMNGQKENPIDANGKGVTIPAGQTHTFAVWHRPNEENIPELKVSMRLKSSRVVSDNSKPAKNFSMAPGKAYRVQAEWKNNRLTIAGEIAKQDLPSMTLTTTKEIGQEIILKISAAMTDQSSVWIDLNNNGVRDAQEDIPNFRDRLGYRIGAKTVTVYGKVSLFECHSNSLTSLDVSQNPDLTSLDCESNQIATLDVTHNPNLAFLYVNGNKLTSLKVGNNMNLVRLSCNNNELTDLDVSGLPNLHVFACSHNNLSLMDVSNNTKLFVFECDGNRNLTSLSFDPNVEADIYCRSCKLSASTLDAIFEKLPDLSSKVPLPKIYIHGNEGTVGCDKLIAIEKGWVVSDDEPMRPRP